jgi:retinol-binding protein 3
MKRIAPLLRTITLALIALILPGFIASAQTLMPGPPDLSIDAPTKKVVIDSLLSHLKDSYVFPEVVQRIEADIWTRQKSGDYDSITSSNAFAKKLSDDLQSVSHDKHLVVHFLARVIPDRTEPNEAQRAEAIWMMKRNNYGFNKVERLDGNIGLIELRQFADPESGADTVAAAMTFLANTESIIFDLRQNNGGSPAMVALISSYLFGEKPVHLNDLYWRTGDRTQEFWTKPEKVLRRFPEKDLYILTSNNTFSAGEEFSNNLKTLKRATIIGERTGGGANPGNTVRLNEHFSAFIPSGRAINPITKTNWEGVGVEPDIKVPKEQASKTAHLMALNRSIERQTNEDVKVVLKFLVGRIQKELDEMKPKD